MTTWKSESDVLLDLDTLSGFSSVRLVSHPTSKAFGGLRSLSTVNQIEKTENTNDMAMVLDSQYNRIPTGRGQLIQQLSELKGRNRPGELHSQLRKACGKGYSNELIEAEFGFSSKGEFPSTDKSNIVEGIAERTLPLSTPSSHFDNGIVGQTPTVSGDSEVSRPTKHNKLFACPRQGLKRRNNVLLNSLLNLQHTQAISSDCNTQHIEDDSLIDKEITTQSCNGPHTTLLSGSHENEQFLTHKSESISINSAKDENTSVSGNKYVTSDTKRKNITIADYLPGDGVADLEQSQFGDGTYSNSVVLSGPVSDINFTKDDFPPL